VCVCVYSIGSVYSTTWQMLKN